MFHVEEMGKAEDSDTLAIEIENLFREKYAVYLGMVRAREPNIENAEDVVQDVFVKAHRNRHKFKGGCTLDSWVWTITVNHLRSMYRSWGGHEAKAGDVWER